MSIFGAMQSGISGLAAQSTAMGAILIIRHFKRW